MAIVNKSIVINAPAAKVYDFLADPQNILKTMAGMQEVSDIQDLPNGGKSFRWKYKMAGMTMDGKSEDVTLIPNQYREASSKGGINSTFKWSMSAEGDATRLALNLEYTVPLPVLGKLAEAVILKTNEQEAEDMLGRVKGFCEAN
jgi:uncharacterized membrane protein